LSLSKKTNKTNFFSAVILSHNKYFSSFRSLTHDDKKKLLRTITHSHIVLIFCWQSMSIVLTSHHNPRGWERKIWSLQSLFSLWKCYAENFNKVLWIPNIVHIRVNCIIEQILVKLIKINDHPLSQRKLDQIGSTKNCCCPSEKNCSIG
jgi:hypothetical protein